MPRGKDGEPSWLCYDQKTANLTEEDLAIRAENLEARRRYNDTGLRKLASAVCLCAVKDYRKAKNELLYFQDVIRDMEAGKRYVPKSTREKIAILKVRIKECEDFFGSDLFVECSGIEDRNEAIRKINRIPKSYDILLEKGRY